MSHDEALMAIDYAAVAAAQVAAELDRAARARPEDMLGALERARRQAQDILRSLDEAEPFAAHCYAHSP